MLNFVLQAPGKAGGSWRDCPLEAVSSKAQHNTPSPPLGQHSNKPCALPLGAPHAACLHLLASRICCVDSAVPCFCPPHPPAGGATGSTTTWGSSDAASTMPWLLIPLMLRGLRLRMHTTRRSCSHMHKKWGP